VILCVTTLIHSTLGFGTASVAMPLLALTLGVRTATPLVAFVIVTTTGASRRRASTGCST
jgi:hypothetical protein